MARLTWQNVAAPNFSGVADSYRTMSDLLGRATDSGSAMVDTFTKARSDAADRMIMERMLGVQTPEQFNPQAIVGDQSGRASMAMLDKVGRYQDTLIDRNIATETHAQNERGWGRLNEGQEQMDNNAAAINAALADAAAGKPGATERLVAMNVRPDVMNTVLSNTNNLIDSRLNQDGTRQRQSIAGYDFIRDKRADTLTDAAAVAQADVDMNSFDPASREAYILSRTDLAPEIRNLLLSGGGGSSGGAGGATGVGSASAAISGVLGSNVPRGTTGAASLYTMTGGAALPDSVRTIGDMVDNKSALLRQNPAGTATGMYQITSDTWADFGPKALGKDWRNADIRDPQVQDKVAESIWNSANTSAKSITNRWVSIPYSEAAKLVGKPWSEVRDIVSQGETSVAASEILGSQQQGGGLAVDAETYRLGMPDPGRALTEQLSTQERMSDRNIGNTTAEYVNTLGSRNFPNAAAKLLAERVGEGADEVAFLKQINKLIDESAIEGGPPRINAAEAAAILELSLDSADSGANWGLQDWITGQGVGANRSVDGNRASALVEDVASGASASRTRSDFEDSQAQALVTRLDANVTALQARIQQARQVAASGRPNVAKGIPAMILELEAAVAEAAEARKAMMEPRLATAPAATSTAGGGGGR